MIQKVDCCFSWWEIAREVAARKTKKNTLESLIKIFQGQEGVTKFLFGQADQKGRQFWTIFSLFFVLFYLTERWGPGEPGQK